MACFIKMSKLIFAGASIVAYSYIFTWQFALVLVAMIFIHEYGHLTAMKQCGMKTKGIYLIPFFGGAAITDDMFKSRRDESYIALMGPWYGLAFSVAIGVLYYITKNPFFGAAASWCAMINIFNLLPINPLDGGRLLKSIAFSIHNRVGMIFLFIGMVLIAILAFLMHSITFVILSIIAILELYVEYRNAKEKRLAHHSYEHKENTFNEIPTMSKKQMVGYFFLYLVTGLALALVMYLFMHIPGVKEAFEVIK